jgi:hypothetical protein
MAKSKHSGFTGRGRGRSSGGKKGRAASAQSRRDLLAKDLPESVSDLVHGPGAGDEEQESSRSSGAPLLFLRPSLTYTPGTDVTITVPVAMWVSCYPEPPALGV